MLRLSLTIGTDDLDLADGALVCRDLSLPSANNASTIRRGTVVDGALRKTLSRYPGLQLDVVCPEPGDIEQPTASRLVAEALAADGIQLESPHQGQVIVRALRDGLLRVRGDVIIRLNALGTFLVATALDGRLVAAGDTIAVVKAARLWMASNDVTLAIEAARPGDVLRVAPFSLRRAAFVVGSRVRAGGVRGAIESLGRTLAAYGTELAETVRVSDEPAEIASTLEDLARRGTEIVLVAGSIVLDPGDPFIVGLESLRARITVRGAPIDPGTMFWVAYVGEMVVFGLASCEMYGRLSVLDLTLPYALAREEIDVTLLSELGYGGLLDQTFSARRRVPLRRDADVDDGS